MNEIRILLVDDHQMFRDGLKAVIDRQPGLHVIGQAEEGRSALKLASRLKPDVVIMDVTMPSLNGIEATRLILGELPRVKIIGVSMHAHKIYVGKMLQAGAKGYLLKDCSSEELIECIRLVHRGMTCVSPSITCMAANETFEAGLRGNFSAALSAREREVLQLIAEGSSSRVISERLHISVKTVESHRKNIMNKLELYTVADLTKYALREGMTSLED